MFSFFAPYKYGIEILGIVILLAIIAYFSHQFLLSEQKMGYDKAMSEVKEKQLAQEQFARAREAQLMNQLEAAQNAATLREQQIKALSAALANSSNSLRDTAAAINSSLPTASADASRSAAITAINLFADCQGKYGQMAEIADRHANDVKTLSDAWPKNSEEKK